jgi:xanthine dehydrogenase accessory factor
MYEIALSVNACVRSKTRADVAWLISTSDSNVPIGSQAIAITPGGGRIGNLLESAFDGDLIELAQRKLAHGRIVKRTVTAFESLLSNVPEGTELTFALLHSGLVDEDLWQVLIDKEAVAIVSHIDGDDITRVEYFTSVSIVAAEPDISEHFNENKSKIVDLGDRILTIYHPVTTLALAGRGPIADAIAHFARALGWDVSVDIGNTNFAGLAARLSPMDAAIIMGHDVDNSGKNLMLALESRAGYIGALGSIKMQEDRADWLAYRDVTDLSRVHGPAGFDIGAKSPEEIAISVLAEAISVLKGV